jgi:hypothetical protein
MTAAVTDRIKTRLRRLDTNRISLPFWLRKKRPHYARLGRPAERQL